MTTKKLEFTRTSRREVLKTPIFRLHEEISVHPETNLEGTYYVLDAPDWVNIVAVTENDELIFVRQWRHGSACVELEIPAGALEAGEDPVVAATRELVEETGYVPKRARLLGRARPNAAILSNHCHTVLCEGCTPTGETHFDAGEQITLEKIPIKELRDHVRAGTLQNGMMLVALLWWLDSEGRVQWP